MENETLKRIEALSLKVLGQKPYKIEDLPLSGSSRNYYRIFQNGSTYIVCISENIEENKTFLRLDKYLFSKGIRVPKIFGESVDGVEYLLSDLGDKDLMSELKVTPHKEKIWPLIEETIGMLVKFQSLPREEWKDLVGFRPFSENLIKSDFKYAMDNFFEVIVKKLPNAELEIELSNLEQRLLSFPDDLKGLMYRDFQSRNIMLSPQPYFIDFQSSRLGPVIYDLVSFAWQAKAGFNMEERHRIIEIYCRFLKEEGKTNPERIKSDVCYWAMFRILQTLGAYGLRGLKEGKVHFIESIPPAIKNLKELLNANNLKKEFPALSRITDGIMASFL